MIIRTKKQSDPFSRISNSLLQDARLSWEARGLAAYLLSLPDTWNINLSDLSKRSPKGKSQIQRILKELRLLGYAELRNKRAKGGVFGGKEWVLIENPTTEVAKEGLTDNHKTPTSVKTDIGKNPRPKKPTSVKTPRIETTNTIETTNKIKNKTATTKEAAAPVFSELTISEQDARIVNHVTEKMGYEKNIVINQLRISRACADLSKINSPFAYFVKVVISEINSSKQQGKAAAASSGYSQSKSKIVRV